MIRPSSCVWVVLIVLCAGGCAYRVGPTNRVSAGARTVQVLPFQNLTLQPRLSSDVSTALRKSIQADGTYTLSHQDDADIVLSGEIKRYQRDILTFEADDVRTPRDINGYMVAQVVARDRASGDVILDREVTGHSKIRIVEDLPSAERQAVPLMAEDLARIVTDALVDGSW